MRLTYTRAEWLAIAHELMATDRAPSPPGLIERIRTLLHDVPVDWTGETCALELDPASADAVFTIHATLAGRNHAGGQQAAVAAAEAVIRDHQEGTPGHEQVWIGKDTNALELQSKANRFLVELGRRGGAVLQTHYVAVEIAPGGIEYSLCLIYRDAIAAAPPPEGSDATPGMDLD